MEIEVGEYVRTNTGLILKYDDKNQKAFIDNFLMCPDIMEEKIVKHSKNIIDLIEESDFVNGYYVRKIANYNNELCVFDLNIMQWIPLTEIDVFYSIVTHEQFESIEYKVEEKKQWI